MIHIHQYFDEIDSVVTRSGAISHEVTYLQLGDDEGFIDGMLRFGDGSYLSFSEHIIIRRRKPEKLLYRYQYIRNDKPAFRYDNAPHHPKIDSYPHHKHIGPHDRKVASFAPKLHQVLEEISELLR